MCSTDITRFPSFETLRLSIENQILTVFLNRPAVRNAMNLQMCDDIISLFETIRFASDIRVVVIRAEGSVFCAGVDIREVVGHGKDWVLKRRNRGLDAFLAIERCPLPVISVAQGPVIGAGCEIATASDFIYAGSSVFFQWPEALRGGVGATQRLPRAIGRAMAKELLYTARKVPANEAAALRIVNRVVDAAEMDQAVNDCVREILACGPIALRLIKQAIDTGEALDRNTAINVERQLIAQSLEHDEWRAALSTFIPRQ